MKTFEDVKAQIEALPHREYMKLVHWFAERDADAWDEEIERDAANGRLDFLIEEALAEKKEGKLHEI
jgi:hypothetical protein